MPLQSCAEAPPAAPLHPAGKLKGAPVAVKLAPFTHVGAGECYDLKTEPLLTLRCAL